MAPAFAAAADPVQVSFTLEGCRPGSPVTFPATGPFICPDADYTTGNLGKTWNEGDYVPFRVTADNRNGAQTYDLVIAADYRLGDTLGYDSITVPTLNDPLSDDACTAPNASNLSYASGAAAVGGIDETIYRTLTITQPADATCVYDYAQRLAISFPGRTAEPDHTVAAPLGASFFSGSSLHGYLLNADLGSAGIGQRRVPIPVNEIEPQGFGKSVDGTRGTGSVWGVTKSSGPAGFPNTCTGATTSDPVEIRVEWTKTTIAAGQVAVTTTFIFDNPAHRPLDVSVDDTLRDTDGGTVLESFTENYQVNPGHREFSVTRQVTTASGTLFNTATATYTDPVSGDEFGSITATDDGAVTAAGAGGNATATITDVEQITGNGLTFSVDSVTTAPALPADGFDPALALGAETTGPVTWKSGTVSGSGSVTFVKRVHVTPGATTSGSLSDVAVLKPSDSGEITASAATPIQAIGCGTVSGTKFADADRDGRRGQNEPGLGGWTFYVDLDADGTLDADEPSDVSAPDGTFTITGVKPGTYPVREVSQSGWVCTTPAPCEYSVTLNGDTSVGNVFGNYRLTPSILLDKTGPATAEAGSLVAYTINVTNNGDLPLTSVVVTDPLCTAAPVLVSKNGDLTADTLDPIVDGWTYTCSVQTTVGQTSVDNVANVTANAGDAQVSATDNAVTTLSQPGQPQAQPPAPPVPAAAAAEPAPVVASGVLSETSPPVVGQAAAAVAGTAKLLRPTRCVARSFTASVSGKRIARVRFYVDGKLIATVRRSNGSGGRWRARIDTARYRAGSAHRLVARIGFAASANTRPSVQSTSLRRCGIAVVAPAFTG
ncbi:MAG TPA: hypothetical protein VMY78_01595 [Solirubrobacteraceae bacterium]|nr:hypothetical protein [Solirubrobacteraceae bacterium]